VNSETTSEAEPGRQTPPKRGFKFGMTAIPLLIFAALAIMFGLALVSGDPSKVPSALIGKPAPDVELPPLDGLKRPDGSPIPSFRRADLTQGKVSVVNFWASWCVPCVQEHPLLIALARETGAPVFGVNYKDPNGGGLKFLTRLGNPFQAVAVDPKGRASIEWGVYGMPETFVVDGNGVVIHKHVGPISPRDLTETLIPLIRDAQASKAKQTAS
jgi:cytochrome c biogenesis protein CcmG/thiol:disulfide interchange protein DsbE